MARMSSDLGKLFVFLFGWLFCTRFGNIVLTAGGIACIVLGVKQGLKPALYVGIGMLLVGVVCFIGITLGKRNERLVRETMPPAPQS
jgi:hypothetical protein